MKTRLAIAVMAIALVGCAGATTPSVNQPSQLPETAAPTTVPTPTPTPTAKPTPTPQALSPEMQADMAAVNAAIAAKDCDAIVTTADTFIKQHPIESLTGFEVTRIRPFIDTAIAALNECLPKVIPFGTVARAGDWDIKVNGKVNFDAWKAVKAENMFNDPAPKGWKMVLVPLALTNRGDVADELVGSMGYVIGDATGVERTDFDDPTCGVIPKELDAFTTVRPGGTLKGNMCFVVENADIATLRLGWPTDTSEPDVEFALR